MTTAAFSHVGLNCRNIDQTAAFYTTWFGFAISRAIPLGAEKIVFLRSGDCYLELFAAQGENPGPPADKDGPAGPGFRHLAFKVENVDRHLEAMGTAANITFGPLGFDDFISGWRSAWVKDPDGRIVEISQGYRD